MASPTNHWKLGLFVVVGVVLSLATVTFLAFEASQIGACRALKQSGAVLVDAIQSAEKFRRKCDRSLDPHKINIPQTSG